MAYVAPYLSSQTQFSYEEEAVYRTKPANIDRVLRLQPGATWPFPKHDYEYVHSPGYGRKPAYVNAKKKWSQEGSFSYEVVTGEFIGAILGDVATVGGAPPYTHTITPKNTNMPSFSVQKAILKSGANLVTEYLGCRVNTATFKVGADAETLMCDVDYLAATAQDGGDTEETIVNQTTKPFVFKEGVFSSTALYAGAKARVYDFELPVNNNAAPGHTSGYGYKPYEILPGFVDFGEMKLTVGLDDDSEWNELIDETKVDTAYDFSYLFTRAASDTLTFSGTAKFVDGPPSFDDKNVKAKLILVPETLEIEIIDAIDIYPFQ